MHAHDLLGDFAEPPLDFAELFLHIKKPRVHTFDQPLFGFLDTTGEPIFHKLKQDGFLIFLGGLNQFHKIARTLFTQFFAQTDRYG